jgi:hypothetical protein
VSQKDALDFFLNLNPYIIVTRENINNNNIDNYNDNNVNKNIEYYHWIDECLFLNCGQYCYIQH